MTIRSHASVKKDKEMRVIDIMKHSPTLISSQKTVKDAAILMKEFNYGALLVGTHPEEIVGIITDRDITLRVTAEGKDASDTLVRDVMTKPVQTCNGETNLEDAAMQMSEHNIRRLVVLTANKAPGIVTLVELLRNQGNLTVSDRVLHGLLGVKDGRHAKAEALFSF